MTEKERERFIAISNLPFKKTSLITRVSLLRRANNETPVEPFG
jgi:hypothetical protein